MRGSFNGATRWMSSTSSRSRASAANASCTGCPSPSMIRLALANSRMKDFFDVHALATTRAFDGDTLRLAFAATFERRQTPLPSDVPIALTKAFADDPQKRRQWDAFVGRIRGVDRIAARFADGVEVPIRLAENDAA